MIKSYEKDGKRLYEVFVSVRDQNGRQVARRKKAISNEREAKKVESDFRQELESLTDSDQYWTWARWHDECIRRVKLTCKKATVFQYDSRLKSHLPVTWIQRPMKSFTTDDVYELTFNEFKSSATSRKVLFMLVKRIFQMAIEEGIISRNPTEGIKLKREPRAQSVLTATEAQKFLAEAFSSNHRFYPVWVFALKTGMRSGEMYALTWADIDLNGSVIHITKQWTNKDGICAPKNGERRTIPISDDLKDFLVGFRRENPGFEATLFDEHSQNRVSRSDYVLPRLSEWTNGEQAQITKEFCRSIGVTQVKFHDLRATFITNLLSSGVPLVKVMAIVGHRKMSTTDIYLRLAGVELVGATNLMGYALPKPGEGAQVIPLRPIGS